MEEASEHSEIAQEASRFLESHTLEKSLWLVRSGGHEIRVTTFETVTILGIRVYKTGPHYGHWGFATTDTFCDHVVTVALSYPTSYQSDGRFRDMELRRLWRVSGVLHPSFAETRCWRGDVNAQLARLAPVVRHFLGETISIDAKRQFR